MNWVCRLGAASIVALALSPANADESASPFHDLAKSVGLATDPPEPPDYVVKSRPSTPRDTIPVFQTPEEPSSHVKSQSDVEKMDADFDSVNRRHDALRSRFAPSAKAMAQEKAARTSKDKPKPTATPEKP